MASVFIKPKLCRFPIYPLVAVGEKANEKPQKYHWKVITDVAPMAAQIMERADFRRARPE